MGGAETSTVKRSRAGRQWELDESTKEGQNEKLYERTGGKPVLEDESGGMADVRWGGAGGSRGAGEKTNFKFEIALLKSCLGVRGKWIWRWRLVIACTGRNGESDRSLANAEPGTPENGEPASGSECTVGANGQKRRQSRRTPN